MTDLQPAGAEPANSPATGAAAGIEALQALMLGLPQIDLQTSQVVNGKVCARTIFIPAGTDLIGARANKPHINVVMGDIAVTTDAGPVRITGHRVFAAPAGHKRAGRAFADTHWTTIWFTELTEPEAIEDEMTDEAAMLQTRRPGIEYAPAAALEG